MRLAVELAIADFPKSQPNADKLGGAFEHNPLASLEGFSFVGVEALGQNRTRAVSGRKLHRRAGRFRSRQICRFETHVISQATASLAN
jgi:hypothetical protein